MMKDWKETANLFLTLIGLLGGAAAYTHAMFASQREMDQLRDQVAGIDEKLTQMRDEGQSCHPCLKPGGSPSQSPQRQNSAPSFQAVGGGCELLRKLSVLSTPSAS